MIAKLNSLAVPTLLLSFIALAGCASGDPAVDTGGGAAGSPTSGEAGGAGGAPSGGRTPEAAVQHAEPPAPGPTHAPDGAGHVTFAIRTLLLGDRDRDGRPNVDAWKQYGFDLDHRVSGAAAPEGFTGLCTPLFGASRASVQTDGREGIDNAFGASLLPLALGVDSSFTDEVAAGLAGGGATTLVDLEGLGAGPDYTGLPARVYTGAPLGKAPAYDGTDAWPVRDDALEDPSDVATARLLAADSYVVGNTWVGRFRGMLPLELPWLQTHALRLFVRDPVITMDLSRDRTEATNGTIAGVVATDDLIAEARDEALRIDPSLCPGTPTVKAVLAALASASDILADGTQDPSLPCGGISIGVGFTAARVTLGPVVAATPAPPAPACSAGN